MIVFILPKVLGVIKEVEDICNKFLLGVNGTTKKRAKMVWHHLAYPYEEGGIAMKDLRS